MQKPEIEESQNVRQNIKSGIYQIGNQKKSCKRTFKIILFILIGSLIMSEVIMNFHCLIRDGDYKLLILDTFIYMGLLIIIIFETYILCQKMKKKNKKNFRSRYKFRLLLIMYLTLNIMIFICLIIHTVYQLYYAFNDDIEQTCYYSNPPYLVKILLIIFYFIIECLTLTFLIYTFYKTFRALKQPQKNTESLLAESFDNQILVNCLNTQSLNT